ncbi:DUF4124 domain-containing protein [Metapseudomonas otitidis]|jgi:hypothetical protein|uniref:DUF4124 domain-containing protein n=1 Tax=Metapseudomonas otitidis TaxID=319939 RepID=A0A1I0SH29_9GAMM|nr:MULTISPECIES: DUF4124 domain-containing protein [Pseudomonas]MDL5598823.1 DUF4124 domain-containing protein [Bacillus subtilis]KIV74605.1 hypothetical protein SZ55_0471 [Pseudomonas sp. FeS53a]MBO2926427.1 DUF4124 domain-containing protein [Pseudomonas otitidis]MDG9781408.1 DUF4124 domain-containing protein [Pseudomonas otitidis]MDH0334595.1 DUF4124 domain-containing protein [Pseudomonas otitidis]
MLKPGAIRLALILGAMAPLAAQAELYRYTNEKGVTVLDRLGVPPQFIDKGYEVLNDQGRVVKTVPPAPTLEERQRMQADKARAGSDAQLLRLYTSVEDVDRALQRKLSELDGLITVAKGNQQSLRTQQANLQAQAADNERAGRQVPEALVAQIDNVRSEYKRLDDDIARYQDERKKAQATFAADRARLAELLNR